MLAKNLDAITLQDIEKLVADQIPESKSLEYKGAFYRLKTGTAEEQTAQHIELLKDISALANTLGGDLIIGVSETKGVPKEACGFEVENADKLKLDIAQLVQNWIEPRVSDNIRSIRHSEGRSVFVIRVAQSTIGPHRVIYKNEFGQFYARNSAGVFSMDTAELRQAFTMSETIFEKIRKFHAQRVAVVQTGSTPIVLTEKPKVILHLIPFDSLASNVSLDIVDLERFTFQLPLIGSRSSTNRVNLDGVAIFDEMNHQKPSSAYTQIFRNGIMETVIDEAIRADTTPQNRPMFDYTLLRQIFDGVKYQLDFLRARNISPPVWCFMTVTGAKEFEIWSPHARYKYPCDRDVLNLPEIQITDLGLKDYSMVLKPMIDALWNSAGHTHCHMYKGDKFVDT